MPPTPTPSPKYAPIPHTHLSGSVHTSYPFPSLKADAGPSRGDYSDRRPSLFRAVIGALSLTLAAGLVMGLASTAYALAPWFASAICVLLCGGCGIVTISLRKNQYVEMAIRHRDAQAEFRRGDVRKAA